MLEYIAQIVSAAGFFAGLILGDKIICKIQAYKLEKMRLQDELRSSDATPGTSEGGDEEWTSSDMQQ